MAELMHTLLSTETFQRVMTQAPQAGTGWDRYPDRTSDSPTAPARRHHPRSAHY
jgi:hypothetical protein